MINLCVLTPAQLIAEADAAVLAYAEHHSITEAEAFQRADVLDQHQVRIRHRALRIVDRRCIALPEGLVALEHRLLQADPYPYPPIETAPIETNSYLPATENLKARDTTTDVEHVSVGVATGATPGEMRKRALGVIGRHCTCVIPGHEHQAEVGEASYHCEQVGHVTLAQLRALIAYRRRDLAIPAFSAVELARWGELLDYEAGILDRQPRPLFDIDHPVARGIERLLALRDPTRWSGQPFTFARSFSMAWCDICNDYAKEGMRELRRRGLIERVGSCGRAALWRVPAIPSHASQSQAA